MTVLKRLVNSTATYALANVINSAIPFLLLPVLTRVLAPAEYGVVTMFATVVSVLTAFTGLSIHGAVSVRHFDADTDHPRFVGTCLGLLAVSTSLVLLSVWLMAGPLSRWVEIPEGWLLVAVLASAAQAVVQVRLVVWQVRNEVWSYGLFQILQTALNLGLSLGLILLLGLGWEGRVLGICVAVFLFAGLALYGLQRRALVRWSIDREYIRAALNFGVPLIPHAVGAMMIAMSDRFIITHLLGIGVTGAYAVGVQMGMVVGLLADAFVKAFGPHLFSELKNQDPASGVRIVRQCAAVFLGFMVLALGYVASLPYLYPLIVGEQYGASLPIAQLIGFGNAFMGMYYVVAGFLFFFERTRLLAKLTLVVGVISIFLTYALVGSMGVSGAALAYVLVQLLFFLGAWYLAQRVFPLPWGSLFSKRGHLNAG
ncbi:Membrane protein involved in the export of O-antigen and teichoic acid [Atopomonas hussainii]|uniref:Membrane protein involved in the export of O-antigen and teichoic acid n=1 Tax=Atopomonas hussainii TaxID=1429083 RepID=A0A1H7P137_9GAMM|nr:oligosaccharide flippase family protein [Atopomonas hussainii]SEL29570.1 Membrane protein involved in the export of O-antigen and teichoic acid [Atopomonas hussainii]